MCVCVCNCVHVSVGVTVNLWERGCSVCGCVCHCERVGVWMQCACGCVAAVCVQLITRLTGLCDLDDRSVRA